MSAFDVIGGTPVQPSRVNYRAITLTADLTLQWPWVIQDTADTVAYLNDVTPDVAGWAITMPAANQAPTGMDAIFRNIGAHSFDVVDADGGAILTVGAGEAWYCYITDNSDEAGTWSQLQFGAGTSAAQASALAGKGLVALANLLNQNCPVSVIVADQTLTATNRASMFVASPVIGGGTLSFDPIASLGAGNFFIFSNLSTGAWTLDPDGSETIDNETSIVLNPGEACVIHVGSTGLFTEGRGRSPQFAFSLINLDVSGNTDVTLTTSQASNFIQRYFGALTGNINVIVPDAVQPYVVFNDTSGAFTLTVKTAAGTGLVIGQGQTVWLYCDGTDVLDADTETPTPASTLFGDGSEASPSMSFVAQANLGAWRKASNTMAFSANANEVWLFDTTGIDVTGGDLKKGGRDISVWATVFG
jgi:hypothetical protein